MDKKEIFVIKPKPDVYYGVRVSQNTKLSYKNDNVNQTIENLVLKTELKVQNEVFKSVTNTEIKLYEGQIVLLEEDKRGYFIPKDAELGSIDEAIDEMKFLKEQINKIKE